MSRTSNTSPRRSVTRRRVKNTGVAKLRQAADKMVEEHRVQIAEALYKQIDKGNASSARLLLQLAESNEWVDDEESVSKVLSIAETWKNEPEWTGPAQARPLVENREQLMHTDGKPQSN